MWGDLGRSGEIWGDMGRLEDGAAGADVAEEEGEEVDAREVALHPHHAAGGGPLRRGARLLVVRPQRDRAAGDGSLTGGRRTRCERAGGETGAADGGGATRARLDERVLDRRRVGHPLKGVALVRHHRGHAADACAGRMERREVR